MSHIHARVLGEEVQSLQSCTRVAEENFLRMVSETRMSNNTDVAASTLQEKTARAVRATR